MEKFAEERPEPEVEVIHEPQELYSSAKESPTESRGVLKKWGALTRSLVGLGVLGLGVWGISAMGLFSVKKAEESPEFKALKEEVKKLNAQTIPLKNEIQILRNDQKAVQEQLAVLKEKISGLTKKTEGRAEKTNAPPPIHYKIKKGDTIPAIAQKYKVQAEDLKRWNPFLSKGNPKPGKMIIIYSPAQS
jgi:LysM repeat protein